MKNITIEDAKSLDYVMIDWYIKKIDLTFKNEDEAECYTNDLGKLISKFGNNPEESIADTIEYLVDNDLIK